MPPPCPLQAQVPEIGNVRSDVCFQVGNDCQEGLEFRVLMKEL